MNININKLLPFKFRCSPYTTANFSPKTFFLDSCSCSFTLPSFQSLNGLYCPSAWPEKSNSILIPHSHFITVCQKQKINLKYPKLSTLIAAHLSDDAYIGLLQNAPYNFKIRQ